MYHVARQLRVHTRMHALCTFPLFLFLFSFLSHSLRLSNRETRNDPNFLCFSGVQKFEFISFVERIKGQEYFFFFKSHVFLRRIRSFFKISNLFRSSKEIKTIRRRFKRFFSQNIFQRVDRILSNLNIQFFLITKPTTNYRNHSITRFKISTRISTIQIRLEYLFIRLDVSLKSVTIPPLISKN